jgi:hypothetical protein
MRQKRRHRGDDAGAIRAGQGQHELIGHGGRFSRQEGREFAPCSITGDGLAPIPLEAS